MEDKDKKKNVKKIIVYAVLLVLIMGIALGTGQIQTEELGRIFTVNAVAVCKLLLLIFGVYIPVISAIRAALGLQLSYVPNLIFFGLGIVAGACSVVKIIKVCLERFRPQTLYCIVGMMVGSFYAIVMGPTTLEEAQAPLAFSSFHWIAGIIGLALVLGMQFVKEKGKKA